MSPERAQDLLLALHAEVDRAAAALAARHAERPYVCRTQGLPLRWLAEDARGERVELRDICALHEAGEPIASQAEADCWTLGPFEERLRRIQESQDVGIGRCVTLRSLFQRCLPRRMLGA